MADSPERPRSFFVSAGESTEGPYDLAALRSLVVSGKIDSRYQLWDDDAQSWAPYSRISELIASIPETPPPRRGAIRGPQQALAQPDQPPSEAGAPAVKPFSFGTLTPRATLAEIDPSAKSMQPRALPTQRYLGPNSDEPEPPLVPDGQGEELTPEAPPEAPSAQRRRNYSPSSAGANVPRPFSPASRTTEEPEPEPASPFEEGKVETPPPVWPIVGKYLAFCVVALLLLRAGGLVTFGFHQREENQRLSNELAASRVKLAQSQADLKKIVADKDEYLQRFAAAQAAVRNMRVSLFASTRRELKLGDRTAVDQRLFELDQLDKLVPEDEAEQKIRHELTDAFFSSSHPAPTPASPAEPLPTPRG